MTFIDVNIKVPEGMTMYLHPKNPQAELQRNALLLYPYINDKTISHGKAAEILGIPKYDLIELYNHMGLSYLSLDISEVEEELADWEKLKEELV
ncbi:UPF0175 family protein [Frisingicoccus sp.]|uniref:UPF0175 family protein n=1 Tax=Frisingicoccus sp. TaxID=1918627 RepID=UPI003AB46B84